MIKAENKLIVSAIIIGIAVLALALAYMLKPVQDTYGANRADLTSCVSSSTYFSLVANTMTRIAATNTARMHFAVEATSTPGSVMVVRPGYGLPNPVATAMGRQLQTASSSLEIDEDNLENGPIWAISRNSVANIFVEECTF